MEESAQPTDDKKTTRMPKRPSPKTMILVLIAIFTLLLIAAAITSRQKSPTTEMTNQIAPAMVSMTAEGFSPATVNIQIGQSVTWSNTDSASHQVSSDPHPSHDSLPELTADNPILSNETYTYTFEEAGTYTYHDELNPSVTGTVIVE